MKSKHRLLHAILICVFGVLTAVMIYGYTKQNYANSHYLPVDAVITKSRETHHRSRSNSCSAQLEFSYQVSGQSFTGTRYAFISKRDCREKLSRYPLNAKVTAYYDPVHPEMAILDNSPWSLSEVILGLLPAAIFVVALLILVRFLKRRARYAGGANFPDR